MHLRLCAAWEQVHKSHTHGGSFAQVRRPTRARALRALRAALQVLPAWGWACGLVWCGRGGQSKKRGSYVHLRLCGACLQVRKSH